MKTLNEDIKTGNFKPVYLLYGDPLPQKTWQKIGERMQTELDLRDKEAGEGADALKQQVKAANRSRRSYKDFLRLR